MTGESKLAKRAATHIVDQSQAVCTAVTRYLGNEYTVQVYLERAVTHITPSWGSIKWDPRFLGDSVCSTVMRPLLRPSSASLVQRVGGRGNSTGRAPLCSKVGRIMIPHLASHPSASPLVSFSSLSSLPSLPSFEPLSSLASLDSFARPLAALEASAGCRPELGLGRRLAVTALSPTKLSPVQSFLQTGHRCAC